MKKIILLFIAANAAFSAFAQVRGGDNFYAQKWVVDLNLPVGVAMQSPTMDSKVSPDYSNLVNPQIGTTKMNSGLSYGVDLQAGYFVGNGGHWGIGTGIMYTSQATDLTLDKFHVEYQDFDSKGFTYRQLVTSTGPIKESLTTTSISIPVVLKYKKRFSTRIGFTADAGILYNVSVSTAYKTDAAFDYEAIYAFVPGSKGSQTYYDNASTPSIYDWLITKDQYEKHTSNTVAHDFDSLRTQGYNVGLNIKPTNNSGTVTFKTGSIGFILRPSLTIRLLDRVHLSVGAYYTYQSFENKTVTNYKLITDMGSNYTSLLSTVKTVTSSTAGLNIGLRYFIGTPKDSQFDGKFDE